MLPGPLITDILPTFGNFFARSLILFGFPGRMLGSLSPVPVSFTRGALAPFNTSLGRSRKHDPAFPISHLTTPVAASWRTKVCRYKGNCGDQIEGFVAAVLRPPSFAAARSMMLSTSGARQARDEQLEELAGVHCYRDFCVRFEWFFGGGGAGQARVHGW